MKLNLYHEYFDSVNREVCNGFTYRHGQAWTSANDMGLAPYFFRDHLELINFENFSYRQVEDAYAGDPNEAHWFVIEVRSNCQPSLLQDHVLDRITRSSVAAINESPLRLVIFFPQEPYDIYGANLPILTHLSNALDRNGIDPSKTHFVFGDVNIKANAGPVPFHVHHYDFFLGCFATSMVPGIFPQGLDPLRGRARSKSFVSFNGKTRHQRLRFLSALARSNVFEKCHISVQTTADEARAWGEDFGAWQDRLPLFLDWPTHYYFDVPDAAQGFMADSYIHIVTETESNDAPLVMPTEKSFKPMAAGQPFIMHAQRGHVARLEELGFDAFRDEIDHSYDLEAEPFQRTRLVVQEVQRLCALEPHHLHAMMERLWPRLLHNRRILEGYAGPGLFDRLVKEVEYKSA